MVSDSIADLLIRIKNGYLARKKSVLVPYFKLGEKLLKILTKEGFIGEFKIESSSGKNLLINLKYDKKIPLLTDVTRVSKPGLRIYVSKGRIPRVLGGIGIVIISTPKGLMTGREAKKQGLGGELLCKVW